jgi:type VII secretion-associated protein (TIGR03931 family)
MDVVVEVGPGTIRGPKSAHSEHVSVALECIDDDVALIDEQPVDVDDLWRDVMLAVVGGAVDAAILVCPTWWQASRIERIRAAARAVATTVEVMGRTAVLRREISDRRTVVEFDSDLVVISRPNAGPVVIARIHGTADDADAVVAAVGTSSAVLIDIPVGVDELLGVVIADRLRARGVAVAWADGGAVRRAVSASSERQAPQAQSHDSPPLFADRRRVAAFAGVVSAALLCCGAVIYGRDAPTEGAPAILLVEGRVGVLVPASWSAQRVTSGPGSARVQVMSSSDGDIGLHITQSPAMPHATLPMAADTLRAALDEEPSGVFVDFNPVDHRAGRSAITYREVRTDRHVTWTVLIDDTVRIAIGCQCAPGRESVVREACEQAIRSAHQVR